MIALTEDIGKVVEIDVTDSGFKYATAPDVVGDAVATLEISREPLQEIRGLGYKSASVAQDGLEKLSIPWDTFDCLFIGGTTDWKLSEPAYALTTEAKRRGKWAHMGRVNSFRRIVAASISGYDSVDGTFLAYGLDLNIIRLKSWLDKLNKQHNTYIFGDFNA